MSESVPGGTQLHDGDSKNIRAFKGPRRPRTVPHRVDQPALPESTDTKAWERLLLNPVLLHAKNLQKAPTECIINAINQLREGKPSPNIPHNIDRPTRIRELLSHLLGKERMPLSIFAYEAMMDCISAPSGNPRAVRRMLAQLGSADIEPSVEICNAALRALAAHPNHILRSETIKFMADSGLDITAEATESILVAKLREGQHEAAYLGLLELHKSATRPASWVYDIFIVEFGAQGCLDELLELLNARKALAEDDVYAQLAYYTLDVCSARYHQNGTSKTWGEIDETTRNLLPDGILENIMGTAARHGDAELATAILDIISKRQRVHGYQYEMVAEAQLQNGDLIDAMRVYSVMQESDHVVTKSAVARFRQLILADTANLATAEAALDELRTVRPVPRAMVEAIIEVKARSLGTEATLPLYDRIKQLSDVEPSADVIQDLLLHATSVDTQRSLVNTYNERFGSAAQDPLRAPPDLNKAIQLLTKLGEVNLALRLADPLVEAGLLGKYTEWVIPLVELAVTQEDSKVWKIVNAVSLKGNRELAFEVQKVLNRTRMTKRAGELAGGSS